MGISFFILAEFMIFYCKDSWGSIDNNNIELINNPEYLTQNNFKKIVELYCVDVVLMIHDQ